MNTKRRVQRRRGHHFYCENMVDTTTSLQLAEQERLSHLEHHELLKLWCSVWISVVVLSFFWQLHCLSMDIRLLVALWNLLTFPFYMIMCKYIITYGL